MSSETRNLILAIGLSLLVFVLWDEFYLRPKAEKALAEQKARQELLAQEREAAGLPPLTGQDDVVSPVAAPSTDLSQAPDSRVVEAGRVPFQNDELIGTISLAGARFDDLALVKHDTALDSGVPVPFFKSAAAPDGYFARFSWQAPGKKGAAGQDFVPGPNTIWTQESGTLTAEDPLVLSWKNSEGIGFEQRISLDGRFLFTVSQRVINNTGNDLIVEPYGLLHRKGQVKTDGIFILHEGPFGVIDGQLVEEGYADLKETPVISNTSAGGWMGITDKYWMATLIPDQNAALGRAALRVYDGLTGQITRAEYVEKGKIVAAGNTLETTTRFYAGPKISKAIDEYQADYSIALYDRTIDWGWFYFLTRPMYFLLSYLFQLVGNFGVAIILLTLLVKGALYPLANKGYVSMAHMKKAQPKMKALQERYKDDRQKLSQEMMELYKKEKINPLAGCLPMLLQIPVFFALYKVLYVTIDMRHQPFYGWIQDLSAPDPLTPVNLFGLIPWDPPSFIAIGVWPILMGLSMWLQQKANPQGNLDEMQAKVLLMLPIVFTFVLAQFAAGLVIYWTLNSALSIAQQYYIQKREAKRDALEEAEKKARQDQKAADRAAKKSKQTKSD